MLLIKGVLRFILIAIPIIVLLYLYGLSYQRIFPEGGAVGTTPQTPRIAPGVYRITVEEIK